MNGQEIFLGLSYISRKYIEEAETETVSGGAGKAHRIRRPFLLAAVIALLLLLVGCGFGAGMVLGFMATIYVSGARVYAPLYGILLAVTLFGICRQRSVWKEPAAVSSAVFLTALTVVCCAVNVLFIVLSL